MGEEALKRALIILSMWHVDWISCDFPHCISALGCPWMALSGESRSSDPDWMPLWGLSYKKVRFKRPKVLIIVRVWDISQQCETFQTMNLSLKRPKLWDVWNQMSFLIGETSEGWDHAISHVTLHSLHFIQSFTVYTYSPGCLFMCMTAWQSFRVLWFID